MGLIGWIGGWIHVDGCRGYVMCVYVSPAHMCAFLYVCLFPDIRASDIREYDAGIRVAALRKRRKIPATPRPKRRGQNPKFEI
eukprot:2035071-Rhodomonas_salina.2